MRKLIATNMMSLDGYYEGPGKNVMDLFSYRTDDYLSDESFDMYNAERLSTADMLLLGHKSYKAFMSYWPSVVDDSNAGSVEKDISQRMNAINKVVISDNLVIKKIDPWQNTRIINTKDAYNEIAKLKKQKGKDILVFASHYLWNDLLAQDLVDELHLIISPVVLDDGTPIFTGKPPVTLRLIDSRTWKGSTTVLVRYEVSR